MGKRSRYTDDASGWIIDSRQEVRDLSLPKASQTASGAPRALDLMGTGGIRSPGVKRPEREVHRSSPSRTEVKNAGAIPQFSHVPS